MPSSSWWIRWTSIRTIPISRPCFESAMSATSRWRRTSPPRMCLSVRRCCKSSAPPRANALRQKNWARTVQAQFCSCRDLLGNRRALARVLLSFTRGALALLVRGVLVRRELPGPAAWPLAGVLLGLDGGAFTGLVGRVLVRLEGSGARARTGRRGGQLVRRSRIRRRGGERTGQCGPDHAARDQRSGDAGDRNDALRWSDTSHLLLI